MTLCRNILQAGNVFRLRIFILILLLLTGLPVMADMPASQVSFIGTLYRQQRYFDCIGEAYRLKSFVPPARHGEIDYFIYGNYFLGRQYYSVIQRVSQRGSSPETRTSLLLARSFMSIGDYRSSLGVLGSMGRVKNAGKLAPDLFAARITSLVHLDKFKEALGEVRALRSTAISPGDMAALEKKISAYRSISRRSPWLGSVMSGLVPGAGQLYSGRYLDALLSIVSVAAPLTGGIFLYREGRHQLAGTLFFFSAVFYGGNIYGAWNAGKLYNRRSIGAFRKSVEGSLPTYNPMHHLRDDALIRGEVPK